MPEVVVDAIYQASADALATIAQLGAPGWRAPPAAVLRNEMIALLKGFVARCREASIPDAETAEARYALVAFIDDQVLRQTAWSGRAEWMSNPLQLQFFREYAAGENFFARMRSLAERGPPFFALEVYYLCIALGFVGAHSSGAQPPRAYAESVRTEILGGRGSERIAPNAVPPERIRAGKASFPVAAATAVACALVTLGGLIGLQLSLGSVIDHAAADLAAAKGAASAGGVGP